MQQELLNEMLANAVHFGHKTQKWNPKMKKYIYGKLKDIHVINLVKTEKLLEEALIFIKKIVSEGKTILLVGTKDQAVNVIKKMGDKTKMPYINHKWIGGFLTNYSTIRTRIKYLKKLKEQRDTGEFEKYTKKEASDFGKEIEKLENSLGGVENITSIPDALFIIDISKEKNAVAEANKLKIPIIAICDTNSDPSKADYPIPANDDSIKSITFLTNKIEDAILSAKK
jgi:small subunit ribosomal protein S2